MSGPETIKAAWRTATDKFEPGSLTQGYDMDQTARIRITTSSPARSGI